VRGPIVKKFRQESASQTKGIVGSYLEEGTRRVLKRRCEAKEHKKSSEGALLRKGLIFGGRSGDNGGVEFIAAGDDDPYEDLPLEYLVLPLGLEDYFVERNPDGRYSCHNADGDYCKESYPSVSDLIDGVGTTYGVLMRENEWESLSYGKRLALMDWADPEGATRILTYTDELRAEEVYRSALLDDLAYRLFVGLFVKMSDWDGLSDFQRNVLVLQYMAFHYSHGRPGVLLVKKDDFHESLADLQGLGGLEVLRRGEDAMDEAMRLFENDDMPPSP